MFHDLLPAFLVAGVIWWACGPLVHPYLARAKDDRNTIASLREQIAGAHAASQEIRTLAIDATAFRAQIDRLEEEIPGPSVRVSLPEQVKQHFARFGLRVSVVRMNSVREDYDLPGYDRGYWSVSLPIAEARDKAAASLLAVAEFEQQHPFVRILDFAIQPDPEDPAGRVGSLSLATLIRK